MNLEWVRLLADVLKHIHNVDFFAVALKLQVVDALVPLAEMFQYVSTLRGMTKGRASYTMQLAQFDVVPQHIQTQLSAKQEAATA